MRQQVTAQLIPQLTDQLRTRTSPLVILNTSVVFYLLHRESKKGDTILLSMSLLNIDRFSQFFHRTYSVQ